MDFYFDKINKLIEERIVNKKYREIKDNSDTLKTNWEIGKLLYEAQGGEKRSKYGDGLIKKWSVIFVRKYGKEYSSRNLFLYRQFYLLFPIVNAVRSQLSWTHYRSILKLKNEN